MEIPPIHHLRDERYVLSTDLHKAIGLSQHNYARDINKWITTEYLFPGKREFTYPVENFDYFTQSQLIDSQHSSPMRSVENQGSTYRANYAKEYYIRLEFAKLIALDSQGRFKKQFVQYLLTLESRLDSFEVLPRDMILGLLEIAKLCTYVENQISYYKAHKEHFNDSSGVSDPKAFDFWRNAILKIENHRQVKEDYRLSSIVGNLKTKIEQGAFLDSIQSIRDAMFDFLRMAIAKYDPHFPGMTDKALDLANFTKKMMEVAGMKPQIVGRNNTLGWQHDLFQDEASVNTPLIGETLAIIFKT